eukprot:EG_transcript_5491
MTDALTVAGLPLWGPLLLLVPLVGAVVAYLWQPPAPKVVVEPTEEETAAVLTGRRKFDWPKDRTDAHVPCWDPSTLDYLGDLPAMKADQVRERIQQARAAQEVWGQSSFQQRRLLLRTILRFIVENMETIAKVACRDSGKTMVDAMFGEVMVTCEKLRWTIANGERYLRPEYRTSGIMNLHKTSRVEYVPVGVVGAIVPFNYPFHNVFNPLIAALFAGNAIVIKVSEYASWSTKYYGRVIAACLKAAGAPEGLVQIVTGYGEAGNALVTGGVDKVIFVGSVSVGKAVMRAAADRLTPVILELGGKDAFIICDDADVSTLDQLACRGVFQNMGQNCAGPERFIVYRRVYEPFCQRVATIVHRMRQGPPLSSPLIDCGACCMPQALAACQRLVDDAVSKGARILAGGALPKEGMGQFYPPTVLCDVTSDMLIAKEEIFGPIMCIFPVPDDDTAALALANDSPFALSGCAHSANQTRAAALCRGLESGMASVNDLEGTTYLSQSLPFGGLKDSGFGRFAGPEGLRGLCHEKSIVENRFSFLKPSIPPAIAYPSNGQGPAFCLALCQLLYGYGATQRLQGLLGLLKASLPAKVKPE